LLGLSFQGSESEIAAGFWLEWRLESASYPELTVAPTRYSRGGGPGDTLNAYRREVTKTNRLLTLYEAILNRDFEALEQHFVVHERDTLEGLREEWRADPAYDSMPSGWNAFLMNAAVVEIWRMVGSALSIFAYPSIALQAGTVRSKGVPGPYKLTSSWGARNLLGVIYLQFSWLITSLGELSRCRHCGRIISHAPPIPNSGTRKPRKDKAFCGRQCRQNYHYHNHIKPTRSHT
jgi:hypothetical protein